METQSALSGVFSPEQVAAITRLVEHRAQQIAASAIEEFVATHHLSLALTFTVPQRECLKGLAMTLAKCKPQILFQNMTADPMQPPISLELRRLQLEVVLLRELFAASVTLANFAMDPQRYKREELGGTLRMIRYHLELDGRFPNLVAEFDTHLLTLADAFES